MNKTVELKKRENSVVLPEFVMVESNTATPSRLEERELPYHFAVKTPTRNFQHFQNRANDYINIHCYLNLIYEDTYSFAQMDKRESKEFSFSSRNGVVKRDVSLSLRGEKSSTWTENIAEIKAISKVQHGSNFIIERLRKFATLEAGWDSYNAKRIEWLTISRAIQFFSNVLCIMESKNKDVIPPPFVAPLPDGGIQFEWNTCYKELIFFIPEDEKHSIKYLKVDKTQDEEKEEEREASNITELIDIVTDWLL